jgi:hypothetical protein
MNDPLHNPFALFPFETFRFHLRIRSLTVLPGLKHITEAAGSCRSHSDKKRLRAIETMDRPSPVPPAMQPSGIV